MIAIAILGLLSTAGGIAMVVVESTTRHSRLSHAADAIALAAARSPGEPDCAFASRIADDYAVRLDRCVDEGLDSVVEVSCEAGVLLSRAARLAGQAEPRLAVTARAGP